MYSQSAVPKGVSSLVNAPPAAASPFERKKRTSRCATLRRLYRGVVYGANWAALPPRGFRWQSDYRGAFPLFLGFFWSARCVTAIRWSERSSVIAARRLFARDWRASNVNPLRRQRWLCALNYARCLNGGGKGSQVLGEIESFVFHLAFRGFNLVRR